MNHPTLTSDAAGDADCIPVLDVGPYLAGEPGSARVVYVATDELHDAIDGQ